MRLVGALYAHLQATVGEQGKKLPEGELLTLIAGSPFQFGMAETPLRADDGQIRRGSGDSPVRTSVEGRRPFHHRRRHRRYFYRE